MTLYENHSNLKAPKNEEGGGGYVVIDDSEIQLCLSY